MMTALIMSRNIATEALVFIIVIFTVAALSGTKIVWRNNTSQSAVQEVEKAKRRTRLDRMLEDMDEQELAELRERIANDTDDDPVPLDQLLKRSQA